MKKSKLRVNVRSKLATNRANISETTIEGAAHIVIKGAKHMISDTVMNRLLYPAEAVMALNDALETGGAFIPAPAEHPIVDGGFVSAADPRALIQHNVGAMHFNFRLESGRLVSDTAINVRTVWNSDRGREIMRRIEQEEPIDISTGFFLVRNEGSGVGKDGQDFDAIASDLQLDHSALLIESPGAKTSDEGVGLFANNAAGERMDVDTVELGVEPLANDDKPDQNSLDIVFNALKKVLGYNEPNGNNQPPEVDIVREEIVAALNAAKIETEGVSDGDLLKAYNKLMATPPAADDPGTEPPAKDDLAATVTAAVNAATKPLAEQVASLQTQLNAGADAELAQLSEQVVNSGLYPGLDVEMVKAMPLDTVKTMAANCGTAIHTNAALGQQNGADSYDMPD
jgi:hypothetical protein